MTLFVTPLKALSPNALYPEVLGARPLTYGCGRPSSAHSRQGKKGFSSQEVLGGLRRVCGAQHDTQPRATSALCCSPLGSPAGRWLGGDIMNIGDLIDPGNLILLTLFRCLNLDQTHNFSDSFLTIPAARVDIRTITKPQLRGTQATAWIPSVCHRYFSNWTGSLGQSARHWTDGRFCPLLPSPLASPL